MFLEKDDDVFSKTSLCFAKNIVVFFLSVAGKGSFNVKTDNKPVLRFICYIRPAKEYPTFRLSVYSPAGILSG